MKWLRSAVAPIVTALVFAVVLVAGCSAAAIARCSTEGMEPPPELTMTFTLHADGSVQAMAPERVPGPTPLP